MKTPSLGCASAGRVTAALLLSFLAATPPVAADHHRHLINQDVFLPPSPGFIPQPEPPRPAEHTFTLRHIYHHGTDRHPRLHRKRDVIARDNAAPRVFLAAEDDYPEHDVTHLKAKSRPHTIERLVDRRPAVVDAMVARARLDGYSAVLDASAWTMDEVPTPDITDKDTVLSLAYMTANAYVEDEDGADWEEVGEPFNRSVDFGWQTDGLRGHVFADETNSTIVIGLKGTTPAVFDGDGTTTNDKINDNLFFSCCCAQQGQWTWHKVCDCATGTYSCNNTCVTQELRNENHYYAAARELFSNVTELYPDSVVWLTGHSLGGAVTSLLGLTYGLPAVTFEAVPEALAASRLGLPVPPGSDPKAPQTREHTGSFHFGHTADPIFIGTCNGATASCSFAGYALETACHTGRECVWDVVADKGWRVGIGTHKIRAVISDVILKYDDVPECNFTPECRDCAPWKMYRHCDKDDVVDVNIIHLDMRDSGVVLVQGQDNYDISGRHHNLNHDSHDSHNFHNFHKHLRDTRQVLGLLGSGGDYLGNGAARTSLASVHPNPDLDDSLPNGDATRFPDPATVAAIMSVESKASDRDESRASPASDSDADSSQSKQPTEWLATTRQRRSTAGNRMKSMLANEEPDSDLELLFAEDENDQGFSDVEGDGSDVQMDSSSDDEDNDKNDDDLEGEKELERQAKERRAVQRKRKAQEAIPAKFRKRVRIDASPASAPAPRPKKKSERTSWLPSPADMPTRASSRKTTRISKEQLHQQMVEREKRRLKQVEQMQRKAAKLEALKKPPMTQEQRLAEAAIVEKRNSKSLNRWEEAEKQREEERKAKLAALNNRTLKGPVITIWSGVREWKDALGQHVTMVEEKPKKKREKVDKGFKGKDKGKAKGQDEGDKVSTPQAAEKQNEEKQSGEKKNDGKEDTPPDTAPVSKVEPEPEPTNTSPVAAPMAAPRTAQGDTDGACQNPPGETQPSTNASVGSETSQAAAAAEPAPKQEEPLRLMAMPPPPPPSEPNARPFGVLAAPVLAPPPGIDMNGPPSTDAPKSNVLAPPNTSPPQSAPPCLQNPQPQISPAAAPAAPQPPPPEPVLHDTHLVPIEDGASTAHKSATPQPPDAPQHPEPPRSSTTARNAIIYQNFDLNAIRDKSVQTQILFGRKMTKLSKPAPAPICVITNQPARYRDPKTGLPFYNAAAYREIQRLDKGDYHFSRELGAWVGSGALAARGVPERFLKPETEEARKTRLEEKRQREEKEAEEGKKRKLAEEQARKKAEEDRERKQAEEESRRAAEAKTAAPAPGPQQSGRLPRPQRSNHPLNNVSSLFISSPYTSSRNNLSLCSSRNSRRRRSRNNLSPSSNSINHLQPNRNPNLNYNYNQNNPSPRSQSRLNHPRNPDSPQPRQQQQQHPPPQPPPPPQGSNTAP
ncbi:autophagy protein atg15 [Purpureocillium lavendulum]|uniref:triacylglycerol lipase n=1 Tax=Purpureocillium lavendulum TaxID=1247861 RepID=A0AB34FS73_9HYPO|nr:autophagy protein atg15 [Purpureocillium lavendulum]